MVEVEVGKHRAARKRTNQLCKFNGHFVLKLRIFATSKVIVDDHIAVESTLTEIKQTIDDLVGRHGERRSERRWWSMPVPREGGVSLRTLWEQREEREEVVVDARADGRRCYVS